MVLFISITINPLSSFAKSKLQFQVGDKISVFAKKAIRRDQGKIFEAIGNTVILHGEETLYGHAARFDMNKSLFEINGNVRYLTKDLTLYGTYLNYNASTENMHIDNARMFTPAYRIVARKVEKTSLENYIAYEAEFTTCKDCTESWTVYGEKVEITVNKYVKITNALMRIKGADAFYLPYIIFPIKVDRETGLLFPQFSIRNTQGFSFAQPWFWAINQSTDMTLTPTIWAERGLGSDAEFRKAFNGVSNYQFETRYLRDEFYLQDFNDELDRYLINSELNYRRTNNENAYLKIFDLSDLDFPNDNPLYSNEKIIESEYGSQGFYNYRFETGEVGIEASMKKTLLQDDARFYNGISDFSDNMVSLLPSFEYAFTPLRIFKTRSDFFNLFYIGGEFEITDFRQNNFDQFQLDNDDPLRNATRLNFQPHLHLSLFDNGVFDFDTTYELGFQNYDFRRDDQRNFRKYSGLLRTEFSFGVDKIYGLAYREKINVKNLGEVKEVEGDLKTIGKIPKFSQEEAEKATEVIYKGYKHLQDYKIIHHFIPGEKEWGNEKFRTQISNIEGWFDYHDAIRSQEFLLGERETRTQVSPQNTIELQWNNSLIEKSPRSFDSVEDGLFLNDNFDYRRVFYFNLSQGVELNEDNRSESDRLTRLGVDLGINFGKYLNLSLEEFFFHQDNKNILTFSMKNDFDLVRVLNVIDYNDFSNAKVYTWGIDIAFTDEMILLLQETRDLEAEETTLKRYALNFAPENDCWLVSFGYIKTINDENFSIDFSLNLGNPSFYRRIRRIF